MAQDPYADLTDDDPYADLAPPKKSWLGKFGRAAGASAVNSATFGLAPKIGGALMATGAEIGEKFGLAKPKTWKERYEAERDRIRANNAADMAESTAGTLAGGVAGGMVVPVGAALGAGMGVVKGAALGGAMGAGQAGVQAFNEQDQGTIMDRIKGAAPAAALGGFIGIPAGGLGGPIASRLARSKARDAAAKAAKGIGVDLATGLENKADDVIREAMEAEGLTPAVMATQAKDVVARSPEARLLDLGHPDGALLNKMDAAAVASPAARSRLLGDLGKRADQARETMMQAVTKALKSKRENVRVVAQEVMDHQRQVAGPIYEAAWKADRVVDASTPEGAWVLEQLQVPRLRKYFREAFELGGLDYDAARAAGLEVGNGPLPDVFGKGEPPTTMWMEYVKRGLQKMERFDDPKRKPSNLGAMLGTWQEALGVLNPSAREAAQTVAFGFGADDAITLGQKLFYPDAPGRKAWAQEFAALPESEQQYALIGIVDAIGEHLDWRKPGARDAGRLQLPAVQRRLAQAIGDEQATELLTQTLEDLERQGLSRAAIRGNSKTPLRFAGQQQLDDAASMVEAAGSVASGNPLALMGQALRATKRPPQMTDALAQELARRGLLGGQDMIDYLTRLQTPAGSGTSTRAGAYGLARAMGGWMP